MKLVRDLKKDAKKELIDKILGLNIGDLTPSHLFKILSDYDVKPIYSDAGEEYLPDCVYVGNTIRVTRDDSWDYIGEVIAIWYRHTSYSCEEIQNTLFKVISEKEISPSTIYEETHQKVYHRIVLNTNDKGILIIPCIKGIKIKGVE